MHCLSCIRQDILLEIEFQVSWTYLWSIDLLCSFSGQITEEESIFTYEDDESFATFAMPNHMPVFLDELLANLTEAQRDEVVEACGEDPSCQFDLLETSNPALAQNSLEVNMENLETQAIASKNLILLCLKSSSPYFHASWTKLFWS